MAQKLSGGTWGNVASPFWPIFMLSRLPSANRLHFKRNSSMVVFGHRAITDDGRGSGKKAWVSARAVSST